MLLVGNKPAYEGPDGVVWAMTFLGKKREAGFACKHRDYEFIVHTSGWSENPYKTLFICSCKFEPPFSAFADRGNEIRYLLRPEPPSFVKSIRRLPMFRFMYHEFERRRIEYVNRNLKKKTTRSR